MRIKRWINQGNFAAHETTDALLSEAGDLLDASETDEILGPAVFEGEDGKCYAVYVEAEIVEIPRDAIA